MPHIPSASAAPVVAPALRDLMEVHTASRGVHGARHRLMGERPGFRGGFRADNRTFGQTSFFPFSSIHTVDHAGGDAVRKCGKDKK